MFTLALDFETRSRVDLKKCGADVYAQDYSTEILCCSFIRKDTGEEWLWFAGESIPITLRLSILGCDEVEAQNARFDQLIYECIAVEDHDFPMIPSDKWICVAAQCRVNALPASLDGATRAANSHHKKDHAGSALIRKLSIPDKKTGKFNEDPALILDMGDYCIKDSRAMVAVTSQMRPMSDEEKLDWKVNERINDRGIKIDRELAELAQKYADFEKEDLGERLALLTDGAVTAVTQSAKALHWLFSNIYGTVSLDTATQVKRGITKTDKKTGALKSTFDKAARAALLEIEDLPTKVRLVVEIFDDGGNSSVAKFTAMLNRADPDTDRVHGCLVFAGAGQTKRYSSKGLQLQNFKRDCFSAEQTAILKELMRSGGDLRTDFNSASIMETLAKLLRPAIMPEAGHKFVVGDWSAIEARVLPWLSDSKGGEKVLDIFRGGRDIYRETADDMGYDDRQTGKVAVLSLGFGGGVGALQAMCKAYGIVITDDEAQVVVDRWRGTNPWARVFWDALELASVKALRHPLTVCKVGRIRYIFVPKLLGGTLICILPDDSTIQYPYAKLKNGTVHCMKASVNPKADSNDAWPTMSLWGGILAQGATQAVAACLLRGKLRDLDDLRQGVIMHLHDEIVLEVSHDKVGDYSCILQEAMETVPKWAEGLPLEAKPEVFDRYGK
tara:strand:+ start:4301 stop:6313 length:2013 start_codon:yes stop_codon:yes gene_type:complete